MLNLQNFSNNNEKQLKVVTVLSGGKTALSSLSPT